VLTHIPAFQSAIGNMVENALENKFGTKVEVGHVDLGFLNRLIIDDFQMYDQQNKPMLKSSRLSVKINPYELITQGKINISSAQLFGLDANLYRKDHKSDLNCQFALDSLASKDTTSHTPLDLKINSLVVRNGKVKYDCYDEPITNGRFNPNHIDVSNISAHILLPHLTDDEVDINVKRLSLKEASGIDINSIIFKLNANKERARLTQFSMKLPQSEIQIDSITVQYEFTNGRFNPHSFSYKGSLSKSKITLSDLSSFDNSLKAVNDPIYTQVQFSGNASTVHLKKIAFDTDNNELKLLANGVFQKKGNGIKWNTNIDQCKMNAQAINFITKNFQTKKFNVPAEITRLGNVSFEGNAEGDNKRISVNGQLSTDAGNAMLILKKDGNNIQGHIDTDKFNLKRITENESFGQVASNLDIEGKIPQGGLRLDNTALYLKAKGTLSRFDYKGYSYSNVNVDGVYQNCTADGTLSMNDANGEIYLKGQYQNKQNRHIANITASVKHLAPSAFHLANPWKNAVFDGDIEANVSGKSFKDMNGTIDLRNFKMKDEEQEYALDHFTLTTGEGIGPRQLKMDSDFGEATITGSIDYPSILKSVNNIIARRLPTLPFLKKTANNNKNRFAIDATIKKSDWLSSLFNIPVELDTPMRIKGTLDDQKDFLTLDVDAPHIIYNGNAFRNTKIQLTTQSNESLPTLYSTVETDRVMSNGNKMQMNLVANASDNLLKTFVSWDDRTEKPFKGEFNSSTEFFMNEEGKPAAHMRIHNSDILINDTIWHVQPSDIVYSEKNLTVDYFAIEHNKQHVIISGKATEHPQDVLTVDLRDVDVSYITNLVNFHSVEFSGRATGKGTISSAFNNPDAHASLKVNDFRFENGRMGTLFANVNWNKEEKQIDIDAHADDEKNAKTLVQGYVSPSKHFIDLNINANNTRAEFLESFCGSFMDNVNLRVNGDARIAGDLKEINLTGMLIADGELDITTLNTRYKLKNDTIRLIPDEIIFANDTIRDKYGKIGIVNGALHHKHLTRMTYDIDVEAQNLLCYDFHDYGDETFFGTVYGTGTCSIRGRSGTIDFDINVTPEKGSFIEYNAASPDAITDQGFITWRDMSDQRYGIIRDSLSFTEEIARESRSNPQDYEVESDLHLNFLFNITPDATLRLLMDKASGDYIALNGTGSIQATYYNKGSFNMFGTYLIDHGVYKLTIQNVIKKDFQFQQGGTIVFGGDPYNSSLNMKGLYTVNGVPLSDLQIGRSFSSNNIRVDCIMNISGTPESPHVDFDLDLPTVNTDAKQMVRSLINSEEEMNQQVIYLLSIGRFYNQTANNAEENQSQTSLAMQSLLSGTISQQINNVLSSFIHTSNWNFGANISTGDEGFNNAEYEGLLSGRLLNNRLLINGQFGYRDNANATTSFIGDFDVRYLLFPNGNLAIKVYNQTNDRYFTRNSLNTQGIGLIIKKDFNSWLELFGMKRKENEK